jgi:hypothetical protein
MHQAAKTMMKNLAYIIFGFCLMFPLGYGFGAMHWRGFDGWGLVHGSFLLAWPALAFIVYGVVRLLTKLNQ